MGTRNRTDVLTDQHKENFMTYRELKKLLQILSEEQLDLDVTVFDAAVEEFYPAQQFLVSGDDIDVLNAGSPYFSFNQEA